MLDTYLSCKCFVLIINIISSKTKNYIYTTRTCTYLCRCPNSYPGIYCVGSQCQRRYTKRGKRQTKLKRFQRDPLSS